MDLTPEQLAEYERRATMVERERCAQIAENATMALSPGPLYTAGFAGAKGYIAGRIRSSNG